MTISVALCTYNGSAFVEQQLRSILDQTVPPQEVVVFDDGSVDGTERIVADVVETWRGRHPEATLDVRIHHSKSPLGVTANFERALAACTGNLIALSDQDDVWPRDRLERMLAVFDASPGLQLLHTDARLVDEAGRPTGATLLETLGVSQADRSAVHAGRAVDVLLRRNIVTGATTMLRRELVLRARPFPQSWVHDEWLAMVAATTGAMDLLDEPLVDYRQHGGNQIGVTSLDAAGRFGRLRAPRTARNRRLLARAEALAERAPALTPPPSPDVLHRINVKLAHERMRSGLPAGRARRAVPVLREWLSGRYSSCGLGLQDVLRDLLQPI